MRPTGSGPRHAANLLLSAATVLALGACGHSAPLAAAPSDDAGAPDAGQTGIRFDVGWTDRTDFEPWEPPLPPGQDGWPTEPPSRWPAVRARLALPDRVSPGDLVGYVVVLRNVSGRRVDLRPCGGYVQEVRRTGAGLESGSVRGGSSTYRLNCDGAPLLMPGESRRFEMRIPVPEHTPGEEVLVSWRLVDNMPDHEAQLWVGLGE